MKSSEKCFLKVNTENLWSRAGYGCISSWHLNLVMFKCLPYGIVLCSMKASELNGLWRATEAWHFKGSLLRGHSVAVYIPQHTGDAKTMG